MVAAPAASLTRTAVALRLLMRIVACGCSIVIIQCILLGLGSGVQGCRGLFWLQRALDKVSLLVNMGFVGVSEGGLIGITVLLLTSLMHDWKTGHAR